MDIDGATVIVSGGAGGLGEATVRRFAARGVSAVIADLDDDRGQALADELGGGARFIHTDVTDEASTKAAIEIASGLGALRVAVAAHGAGAAVGRVVGRDGEPLSLDGFRKTIDVYLTGTFNLLRLSAAAMTRSEPDSNGCRGVVVNTASIAAYEGQIGQSAYAAAKAGVVGLTLAAARDLAPTGVRVMTIAPGTFYTPAFRLPEDEAQARWGTGVPFPNRMGRAAEYGALVEHIVANDYLNGEVIRLDGALRFGAK
jgi:NAD(P)-dependent dehydrogenase (short-subunit alcohol dehydrogenase family)